MQILITHGALARTRVLHFSRQQLAMAAAALLLVLMLASGAVYHWFFLKAAREGWPVVSALVRLVVRDEIAQRDRFLRENLDAMAQKVGEMQARMIQLEAAGERITGLAGVKAEELAPLRSSPASAPAVTPGRKPATPPGATRGDGPPRPGAAPPAGQGGPYLPVQGATLEQIEGALRTLSERADQHADVFTLAESRLFEARMRALTLPSVAPVDVPAGSGFGFRPDPFSGRAALHTGLDFPADVGASVRAAAGGVVASVGWHAQYGQVLEIDHGNGLTTLYAHLSRALVSPGDIVRRAQRVAEVGNSGRSTGPHLHFEVLLQGVPQDPARFLAGPQPEATRAQSGRASRGR
jgi:murein DD-endopeptidase MepM/ murein hydrolase activator NlpD